MESSTRLLCWARWVYWEYAHAWGDVAFSGFDAYVSKMGARGLADVGEKGRKEGEAIAGIVVDEGKVLFAAAD